MEEQKVETSSSRTEQKVETSSLRTEQKVENSSSRTEQKVETSSSRTSWLSCCVLALLAAILYQIINTKKIQIPECTYAVNTKFDKDSDSENGVLKHVHSVLRRYKCVKVHQDTNWDLFWSHSTPYLKLTKQMRSLTPKQYVNHMPGIGFLANKVSLATTKADYIPIAFRLPEQSEEFKEYAESKPNALFMAKHNEHRGVTLKNVSELLNMSAEQSKDYFVQEFISRPLLVDGFKFDIGVYVLITSVNPLRAYAYSGDVLFRYCPRKYHPLEPAVLDSYVIADDYLPTWDVPALSRLYAGLGHSMKDSFDAYLLRQGKDPRVIWRRVDEIIVDILLRKEHHIAERMVQYRHKAFELLRLDLLVDEDLAVHLLEANMSPNLSSAHFPPNRHLYEQILHSVFSLLGFSSTVAVRHSVFGDRESGQSAASTMVTPPRDLAVWAELCAGCASDCELPACRLCDHCRSTEDTLRLKAAHFEHVHRTQFRRLYPPAMTPGKRANEIDMSGTTPANQLSILWYQGKCNADYNWCD